MTVQKVNSQPAFCGRFSAKTLQMAKATMNAKDFATLKKFRAGKNSAEKISVKYIAEPELDRYDRGFLKTSTYMEVSKPRSKKPPVRMFLGDGKMPFDEKMLSVIKEKMAILDRIRR